MSQELKSWECRVARSVYHNEWYEQAVRTSVRLVQSVLGAVQRELTGSIDRNADAKERMKVTLKPQA